MTNSNRQDAQARQQRYELQRILARYQHEYHTGKAPSIDTFVQQYPQFAAELIDFAFYFHTVAADLPEPGMTTAAALSPAAIAALGQLAPAAPAAAGMASPEAEAPPQASVPPIPGIFKQGMDAGYAPPELAEALGISWDILAKLEAKAIYAASVPRTLIERLAERLSVVPEAISRYLGGDTAARQGVFYFSDKPPTQQQESFLDAIQASHELSPEQKGEWAKIVEREVKSD